MRAVAAGDKLRKNFKEIETRSVVRSDGRVVGLSHAAVRGVVRHDGLEEAWTSGRALHYLLLAGLLPEAVWLARELRDWKAAFVLGVVCQRCKGRCGKTEGETDVKL